MGIAGTINALFKSVDIFASTIISLIKDGGEKATEESPKRDLLWKQNQRK